MFPAEVSQGGTLPSCFSSCAELRYPEDGAPGGQHSAVQEARMLVLNRV